MENNRISSTGKSRGRERWARRNRNNGGMPKERKNGAVGYVYIFDIGQGGLYKVGKAGNWQSRLRELSASNPHVKMVLAVRVNDSTSCERHLHKSFQNVHFQRELFRLTYDHIAYAEHYLNECPPPKAPKVEPVNNIHPITGWLSRRKEEFSP